MIPDDLIPPGYKPLRKRQTVSALAAKALGNDGEAIINHLHAQGFEVAWRSEVEGWRYWTRDVQRLAYLLQWCDVPDAVRWLAEDLAQRRRPWKRTLPPP